MPLEKAATVQSVVRALQIIELLDGQTEPLSANEISKQVGINRTTAYGLLSTLMTCGYVLKTDDSKFQISSRQYELCSNYPMRLPVVRVSAVSLTELAHIYEPTSIRLAIRTPDERLLVVSSYSVASDRLSSRLGGQPIYHATGMGKLVAAFLPQDYVLNFFQKNGLPKYTANTKTDLEVVLAEYEEIREQGYSTDRGEFLDNTYCYTFPIRDRTGAVIATFSVSGTKDWFERLPVDFCTQCLQRAKVISMDLGWSPA